MVLLVYGRGHKEILSNPVSICIIILQLFSFKPNNGMEDTIEFLYIRNKLAMSDAVTVIAASR